MEFLPYIVRRKKIFVGWQRDVDAVIKVKADQAEKTGDLLVANAGN
jgi:hypothetical protein